MPKPLRLMRSELLNYLEKSTPEQREQLIAELKHHGWSVRFQKCDPTTGLRWVKSRLLLKRGSAIIRQFRENAKNQIKILDAFEKKKWATTIRYGDYCMNLFGQRMHDTLGRLNKYQSIIRFSYSGRRRNPQDEHVKMKIIKK